MEVVAVMIPGVLGNESLLITDPWSKTVDMDRTVLSDSVDESRTSRQIDLGVVTVEEGAVIGRSSSSSVIRMVLRSSSTSSVESMAESWISLMLSGMHWSSVVSESVLKYMKQKSSEVNNRRIIFYVSHRYLNALSCIFLREYILLAADASGGTFGWAGSDDSESTLGLFKRGLGLRMNTPCGTYPTPIPAPADPPPPAVTRHVAAAAATPIEEEQLKNPELEVGVEDVSSLSEMQSGLELPLRLGPGLAMELYPEELRLDSEVVRLPAPPQVWIVVKGLR